ncbi:hypothetical protein RRG08_055419 [Elysia crispata]|uniref:Uncharacterized protein n=1 Tax=Elysia crispata TaxID=231223 RepID=A0AAE1AQG6_9GAST|nr:hypothetical protein RRG08_055419 [Elysia crispata]
MTFTHTEPTTSYFVLEGDRWNVRGSAELSPCHYKFISRYKQNRMSKQLRFTDSCTGQSLNEQVVISIPLDLYCMRNCFLSRARAFMKKTEFTGELNNRVD